MRTDMPDEVESASAQDVTEQLTLDTIITANMPLVASGPDATLQELRWRDAILRLSQTLLETAAQHRDLSPILLASLHHALSRLLIYGDERELQALELWLAGHGSGSIAGYGEAEAQDRRLGIDRRFGERRMTDRRHGDRRMNWCPPDSEEFQERRHDERRAGGNRRERPDRRRGIGRRDDVDAPDATFDDTQLPIFHAPAPWNLASERLMMGDDDDTSQRDS
jgi:hypothetical protein